MNDIDDVLLQARDALPGPRMETPVEAILATGQSRRHRRRAVQATAAVAASGALALHALEAMEAFQLSADEGRRVKLDTKVERPAMLTPGMPTGQMD